MELVAHAEGVWQGELTPQIRAQGGVWVIGDKVAGPGHTEKVWVKLWVACAAKYDSPGHVAEPKKDDQGQLVPLHSRPGESVRDFSKPSEELIGRREIVQAFIGTLLCQLSDEAVYPLFYPRSVTLAPLARRVWRRRLDASLYPEPEGVTICERERSPYTCPRPPYEYVCLDRREGEVPKYQGLPPAQRELLCDGPAMVKQEDWQWRFIHLFVGWMILTVGGRKVMLGPDDYLYVNRDAGPLTLHDVRERYLRGIVVYY